VALWRQITRGARTLFRRSAVDDDVADEVQHFLEENAAAHRARGLSPDDAARAARAEMGSVTSVREQVRGYGWEHTIDTMAGDLRYACRRLRTEPGFTTIAVLTVALGIGATTAIFSVVNPILFEPLPYPGPGRIAMISEMRPDGSRLDGTFGMFVGLAEGTHAFETLAVFKPWQPTLQGRDQPERFDGQRVSADYFRTLGVAPIVGRDFAPADDRVNAPAVVILSDALWRRRFNRDPAILGQPITFDDRHYTVVGVMPDRFENVLAPAAQVWAPMQYAMSQGRAWGHHLRTVGRLRAGTGFEAASRDVAAVAARVLREQRPETYGADVAFAVTSLQDHVTSGVKPALLAIFGAAGLLLAIVCVNVSNLFLARGVHRRSEFALRAALGAGRTRLIRQLVTESLVLAVLGGMLGIAVSTLGVRALVALSPPGLPRVDAIRVDGAVFAFGLAVTTLIGLIFGFIPALQAARTDPQRSLAMGSHRIAGGHHRTRRALVVAEVALALVLLVSSGLLLRSLERLFAEPAGFDAARVLTLQVPASTTRTGAEGTGGFFANVLDAVRRVPGLDAAALTSQLPMSGDLDEFGVHFDAEPMRPAETYGAYRYGVSPGYLETMGIPLRRGRLFDERDRAGAPPVAVISESLARTRFGTSDPLGRHVRIGPTDGPPYTIVGVVGDVRQLSLALTASDAVYTPAAQWRFPDSVMSLVVRARGDAAALIPAVRQAVWSVDRHQPIVRVALMEDLVAASAAERRFALMLFEAFALAALVLAAAGIYGLLSGSVAERTREIGVRAALGASRRSIVGLVLHHGLRLTVVGVVLGLAGAAAASQAIATMLFGVSRLDPLTYVSTVGLLVTVSAIACALPAWRAARIDPGTTLRAE
jgi:putative ABC transport system permease protein